MHNSQHKEITCQACQACGANRPRAPRLASLLCRTHTHTLDTPPAAPRCVGAVAGCGCGVCGPREREALESTGFLSAANPAHRGISGIGGLVPTPMRYGHTCRRLRRARCRSARCCCPSTLIAVEFRTRIAACCHLHRVEGPSNRTRLTTCLTHHCSQVPVRAVAVLLAAIHQRRRAHAVLRRAHPPRGPLDARPDRRALYGPRVRSLRTCALAPQPNTHTHTRPRHALRHTRTSG